MSNKKPSDFLDFAGKQVLIEASSRGTSIMKKNGLPVDVVSAYIIGLADIIGDMRMAKAPKNILVQARPKNKNS